MELEELLSYLPTTSPAMKTQHTAQAVHSCLCACILSGGETRLRQGLPVAVVEGYLHGFGLLREGGSGASIEEELRQATQFNLGPGSRARLLLPHSRVLGP